MGSYPLRSSRALPYNGAATGRHSGNSTAMSEKPESSDFDEDEADASVDSDDADLEHLIKDLESQKRRGGPKPGEPAWRRLEKYLERKRTAELLSDFDDYEIGDERDGGEPLARRRRRLEARERMREAAAAEAAEPRHASRSAGHRKGRR